MEGRRKSPGTVRLKTRREKKKKLGEKRDKLRGWALSGGKQNSRRVYSTVKKNNRYTCSDLRGTKSNRGPQADTTSTDTRLGEELERQRAYPLLGRLGWTEKRPNLHPSVLKKKLSNPGRVYITGGSGGFRIRARSVNTWRTINDTDNTRWARCA